MAELGHAEVRAWLTESDPGALERLWTEADRVRRERVGDAVHLRGLIEASNHCVRACHYCGLRAASGLDRYRMNAAEILAAAREAQRLGYGSVVIQAGEDPGLTEALVAEAVRAIKAGTPLAVTLSLGERSDRELTTWKAAGADRYLLRFETSDPDLYHLVHPGLPGGHASDRLAQLRRLRAMGYEVGTGVMVGLPGQTWDTLASDLLCFRAFDMDMVGVGPFLPSPRTPMGGPDAAAYLAPEQVVHGQPRRSGGGQPVCDLGGGVERVRVVLHQAELGRRKPPGADAGPGADKHRRRQLLRAVVGDLPDPVFMLARRRCVHVLVMHRGVRVAPRLQHPGFHHDPRARPLDHVPVDADLGIHGPVQPRERIIPCCTEGGEAGRHGERTCHQPVDDHRPGLTAQVGIGPPKPEAVVFVSSIGDDAAREVRREQRFVKP